MSEPINVLLPELIVRPRGSYITYTGKETNRPSVADFIKAKAKEARVEAANKILKQYEPDVPTVTRSITPFNGLAGLVMSEKTRRDLFGIDPSPFTCLYTATTKYNDKDAIATSNKILKNDPQKYGYEPVDMGNTEIGDLVQFSDNHLGGWAGKILGPYLRKKQPRKIHG